MQKIIIGIDPGVKTGYAEIRDGEYTRISQDSIIKVMEYITYMHKLGIYDIEIYIENPNLRKYFGNKDREVLQGAGSIKRDYSIWSEYCHHHHITMHNVSPQSIGSQFDNADVFMAATGYYKKVGIHGRDAAKIIFRFKK